MASLTVTKENFTDEVMKSDKPVLLDFWAPWCGPCRVLGPVVEEVAGEKADSVKVGKVNVDEQPELAEAFGVVSIPTLVFMRDGKAEKSAIGVKPKQAILSMIS